MIDRIRKGVRLRTVKEAPAAAKRDPKKAAVKRLGQAVKSAGGGASSFEDSPVDLAEIGRAYYTDSYIRRAVDKHSALMLKNGWELTGKNDQAVQYVWTRLKLMAEATGQSVDAFLQEIADNFILYGNAYVVKARAKAGALPAGVTAVGYTGKQPIAGYFVLPAQLMKVNRDEIGKILGYQQSSDSGSGGTEFKPEDIVHFPYRRPSGRAYGVPFIFNALDDVKLLRQIEENVARLIYRNLFPLYLYKVGIDKPGYEATEEEIEDLREEIRTIPVDGALVVPERHDIKVVGSQGNAIDANGYLKYFRQRVFSGLWVSDTIMGISDTANKSTSDNQSAALNDSVKDFQKTFADIVKFSMINELLFEGGYDPTLNPEDEVDFAFNEIETDAKIKRENHVVQLFMQNAIMFEEMRQLMGNDTQVDESRLFANMFGSNNASTQGAANQGNNKDQPENQSGKQLSPGKPKASTQTLLTESFQPLSLSESLHIRSFTDEVEKHWISMMNETQNYVQHEMDPQQILEHTLLLIKPILQAKTDSFAQQALLKGFQDGLLQVKNNTVKLQLPEVHAATSHCRDAFNRLLSDMSHSILTIYEKEAPVQSTMYAFTATQYRIEFIVKRIAYEVYNLGVALAGTKSGQKTAYIQHSEKSSNTCLSSVGEVALTDDFGSYLPPHHKNCECVVVLNKED